LEFCGLRRDACLALVSALKSNPSHLKELDLSYNNIGNEAATWLVGLLPDCGLETLRFFFLFIIIFFSDILMDIDMAVNNLVQGSKSFSQIHSFRYSFREVNLSLNGLENITNLLFPTKP